MPDIWRDYVAKPGECIAERMMRAGENLDHTPIVQAFARHRRAAYNQAIEDALARAIASEMDHG